MSFTDEQRNHIVSSYPQLDIGVRTGKTDYIYFLEWDEVTNSVMWGIDCYNRMFVVIKVKIGEYNLMQTFFQRYTHDLHNWNSGSNRTIPFITTYGGISSEQFNFLYNLITTKKAILNGHAKSSNSAFNNKEIMLYDYYLDKSARII